MIQFAHINLITGDWKKLADFYINVFNCRPLLPQRDLQGIWLDKATNIDNAHITGIHLALPGYQNNLPTIEIFQYDLNKENLQPTINQTGLGHIAFKVSDVGEVLNKLLCHGGSQLGDLVETKIPNAGQITFVYARDPDGNIIEIQNWK